MSVLTAEDRAFFEENGYVIVPNAVPQENLDATVAAIWDFLGMDPNDPDDWYRPPHRPGAGMVEMYQHPAMWNNRQHPRIHQAFSELWDTEKLWVSIDRVNMKPPQRPDKPEWNNNGFIHWDADLSELPLRWGVQGVLYLTDTAENQGAFQCIPGIHRRLEELTERRPELVKRHPSITNDPEFEVKSIAGKAGDLVIWHRGLAHGNGPNTSDKPRLAQYISMHRARESNEEARQHRINCWQNRLCPGGAPFPGDPRRWEELHCQTAELTPLGKRLLGLDAWEG